MFDLGFYGGKILLKLTWEVLTHVELQLSVGGQSTCSLTVCPPFISYMG